MGRERWISIIHPLCSLHPSSDHGSILNVAANFTRKFRAFGFCQFVLYQFLALTVLPCLAFHVMNLIHFQFIFHWGWVKGGFTAGVNSLGPDLGIFWSCPSFITVFIRLMVISLITLPGVRGTKKQLHCCQGAKQNSQFCYQFPRGTSK